MPDYLREAFAELRTLNEDDFEATTDERRLQALDDFFKDDIEAPVEEPIIDLDAEDESDLQVSYEGKVILECDCCHTRIYKDEDEVVIDEETGLANADEVCPVCEGKFGYHIIGKIEKYEATSEKEDAPEEDEEPEDNEEPKEVEDEVEDDELDESVKAAFNAYFESVGGKDKHLAKRLHQDTDDISDEELLLGEGIIEDESLDDCEDGKCDESCNKDEELLLGEKDLDEKGNDSLDINEGNGFDVVKKFKDLDDNRTHVIARNPRRKDDDYLGAYAVGLGYDDEAGSWGQGVYDFKTPEEAEEWLKNSNYYREKGYNVEPLNELYNTAEQVIESCLNTFVDAYRNINADIFDTNAVSFDLGDKHYELWLEESPAEEGAIEVALVEDNNEIDKAAIYEPEDMENILEDFGIVETAPGTDLDYKPSGSGTDKVNSIKYISELLDEAEIEHDARPEAGKIYFYGDSDLERAKDIFAEVVDSNFEVLDDEWAIRLTSGNVEYDPEEYDELNESLNEADEEVDTTGWDQKQVEYFNKFKSKWTPEQTQAYINQMNKWAVLYKDTLYASNAISGNKTVPFFNPVTGGASVEHYFEDKTKEDREAKEKAEKEAKQYARSEGGKKAAATRARNKEMASEVTPSIHKIASASTRAELERRAAAVNPFYANKDLSRVSDSDLEWVINQGGKRMVDDPKANPDVNSVVNAFVDANILTDLQATKTQADAVKLVKDALDAKGLDTDYTKNFIQRITGISSTTGRPVAAPMTRSAIISYVKNVILAGSGYSSNFTPAKDKYKFDVNNETGNIDLEEDINIDLNSKIIESNDEADIDVNAGTVHISTGAGNEGLLADDEVIAPLSPEEEDQFKTEEPDTDEFPLSDDDIANIGEPFEGEEADANGEEFEPTEGPEAEEEDEEEDLEDFEDLETESFDYLGNKFARKIYENVQSYETTRVAKHNGTLIIEGKILFRNGTTNDTRYVFESARRSKTGKITFVGGNKTFAEGTPNAFKLVGTLTNNNFLSEALKYNYKVKTLNESKEDIFTKVKGAIFKK